MSYYSLKACCFLKNFKDKKNLESNNFGCVIPSSNVKEKDFRNA